MLQAFRLMLVYTLLDPIKMTVADLFVAVGRPELVFRVRLLQLGVMVVGLFALGTRFNIAGVALAVDTMVVVGITVLLWQARQYVDFSARRLFAVPMLALVLGLAAGAGVVALLTTPAPWLSATLKTVLFVLAYGGVLALLERQTLTAMVLPAVRQLLRRRRPPVEKA